MVFREISAELREAILENEEDILSKLVADDKKIYDDAYCPRCGGATAIEADVQRMLTSSRPIPRYCCRCLDCGCLFEPFARIVLEMGNLGQCRPGIPILETEEY